MPKKNRERYKDRNKVEAPTDAKPSMTLEALKRRRFKRFLFVGLLGISFPILECIAYRYRAITISFTNRTDLVVRSVKVTYDGGSFELPELKPDQVGTRVIRPDFSFKSERFSTYWMTISIKSDNGSIIRQSGSAGALDFSATELYTIESTPPKGDIQLQHSTRPGFPLSLVRDLMERLGIG